MYKDNIESSLSQDTKKEDEKTQINIYSKYFFFSTLLFDVPFIIIFSISLKKPPESEYFTCQNLKVWGKLLLIYHSISFIMNMIFSPLLNEFISKKGSLKILIKLNNINLICRICQGFLFIILFLIFFSEFMKSGNCGLLYKVSLGYIITNFIFISIFLILICFFGLLFGSLFLNSTEIRRRFQVSRNEEDDYDNI